MTRQCHSCGAVFATQQTRAKYCPGCRADAKREQERDRHRARIGSDYAESRAALDALRLENARRDNRPWTAPTLVETPDEPAVNAMRGDYLTGGAAAAVFRGGVVVASGGAG